MRARWLILLVAVLVSGCTTTTGGVASPRGEPRGDDNLFSGDIPSYGQDWNLDDTTRLSYVRALRRIDPCGFRDALRDVGDPGLLSFRFWECEIDLAVQGHGEISVQVGLLFEKLRTDLSTLAYEDGDAKVYASTISQCVYDVPMMLQNLPGAPRSKAAAGQLPVLQVVVHEFDSSGTGICTVGLPIATAIAKRMPNDVPVRSGRSAYPHKLAERDPCEILDEYPQKVRDLGQDQNSDSVNGDWPFSCAFSLDYPADSGMEYEVSLDVSYLGLLELEHYSVERRDGIDYYYNEVPQQFVGCQGVVILGPPLYKRDSTGNLVPDEHEEKTRASVKVMARAAGSGVGHGGTTVSCGKLREMTDKAGRIFATSPN